MKSDMEDETRALTLRIGANAKAIREALGLSYRDAAKLCAAVGYNIAHTFIQKLESGEKNWSMKALAGIPLAYGVEVEALFLPPQEQSLLALVRANGPLAAIAWARSQI